MWLCLIKEAKLEPHKNFTKETPIKKKVLLVQTLEKEMFGL